LNTKDHVVENEMGMRGCTAVDKKGKRRCLLSCRCMR